MSLPEIITWDYQFAPNAQKARNYLYAAGVPFKICEQPFVLPRPILTDLGITYRRVPVVSIGKDVFCDTIPFMDAMQQQLGPRGLRQTPFDRAFEAWGYRSFWICLPLVPADLITPPMAADRKKLFPVFAREDFADLRTSALGEFRAILETAEHDFLADGPGPFINGATDPGMADIHANWMIKWALHTIEIAKEVGLGEKQYPRVYKWCNALTTHTPDIEEGQKLSPEEASKLLFESASLPDPGVDNSDSMNAQNGFEAGDVVSVEATDAEPGTHPQLGKLVGLNKRQIVLSLDNGLRVHFPRIGYVVKKL